MATLTVKVTVAGAVGSGLTVKVYPQSDFVFNPQRAQAAPNATPNATGTTDGTGTASLTGLSAVPYQLLVVDARGVNNWFPVGGQYLNGTYTAVIPWTAPALTTSPIDSRGGDTPGSPLGVGTFAHWAHVHAVAPATVNPVALLPAALDGGMIEAIVVAAPGQWWLGGNSIGVGASVYGLVWTTNSGQSWSTPGAGAPSSVLALAVSGADVLACTGQDGNLYHSTNSGSSWATSTCGITSGNNITSVAVSGSNWIVATAVEVSVSTDSGGTWTVTSLYSGNVNPRLITFGNTVVWIGGNTAGTTATSASSNNGGTWPTVTTVSGLIPATQYMVAPCAVSASAWLVTLYTGTSYGLYETTNAGVSWVELVAQSSLNPNANGPAGVCETATGRLLVAANTVSASPPAGEYTTWFSDSAFSTYHPVTPDPFGAGGRAITAAVDGNTWLVGGVSGRSGGSPLALLSGV